MQRIKEPEPYPRTILNRTDERNCQIPQVIFSPYSATVVNPARWSFGTSASVDARGKATEKLSILP
jgi:hypothetical protein